MVGSISKEAIVNSGVSRNIEALHSQEYLEYVKELGFGNPGRAKVLFLENSLPSAKDSALRSILLLGHAHIATLEGNFVSAKILYEKVLRFTNTKYFPNLAIVDRNNVAAFIHYEYALFCKLVHAQDLAISHFLQAKQLTNSKKLKLLLDYQDALKNLMQSESGDTTDFRLILDRLNENSMKVIAGIAIMRLGNYYRIRKNYTEARKCYSQAMNLAVLNGYKYLQWNIQNSIGLLFGAEGKHQEAIDHFRVELESIESPYFKALMLKNLAIRYYRKENSEPELMLSTMLEALEHCQINGISSQISILAEGIGDLYLEKKDSKGHAYHYYQIAFDEAIKLANSGIPITGQRLRVIEKYNKLIQNNLPKNFMALKEPGLYEWSKGKTWVQIKDLFHYNLFVYHFLHTGIGSSTFTHLNINSGTFYSLSKRMRDLRGIYIPDLSGVDFELPPNLFLEPLQKYAQLHRDKTWKQVNEQFEKDIFEYLFKESGYNKAQLAKMLDRSYAMVIKQTRHLTEVNVDSRESIRIPR